MTHRRYVKVDQMYIKGMWIFFCPRVEQFFSLKKTEFDSGNKIDNLYDLTTMYSFYFTGKLKKTEETLLPVARIA